MSKIIASIKILLFALNCLWVVPIQALVMLFTKGPGAYHLPLIWHRICCFIFGIKYKVVGTPNTQYQTLYMSNHLSYMDISVIGSILKSSFVAKSEVEGWPLFGFLANLQQTAFIQRKRSRIEKEKNALQKRIEDGESLIIFPEGTSSSGFDVVPFKSSLFALAMGDNNESLYIQPITIRVLKINGKKPDNKTEQDIYAWPRDMDMELHHHLWRFTQTSGATLEITFHAPLKASEYTDRKVLAKTCYENVSKGLDIAHAA